MRRIGIVTWYYSSNYGTCLQAYALYAYLNILGYECYFLNRKVTFKVIWNKLSSMIRNRCFLKSADSIGKHPVKMIKVDSFVNAEFVRSPRYFTRKQLKSIEKETHCFITGSDQIWNPFYLDLHYLLADINDSSKKIAYASSIGVSEIPNEMISVYEKYLTRFEYLSLREESGSRIIHSITKGTVETVLDPTFLLTSKEWMSFAAKATLEDTDCFTAPFILCYFVGDNSSYWEYVYKIQKVSQIENIVVIPLEKTHYDAKGYIYDFAGPHEFVWLLNKAALVCTDSFHATALCINLEKDFVDFLRFTDTEASSQNTRMYQILECFQLQDRLYDGRNEYVHRKIDYTNVNKILERGRSHSLEYLKKALG